MPYWVYILASKRNGTLYVGMTNDLARRVYEHQSGAIPGFTHKYDIKTLVYAEPHQDIDIAAAREKNDQALAAGLETGTDRGTQPRLARSD